MPQTQALSRRGGRASGLIVVIWGQGDGGEPRRALRGIIPRACVSWDRLGVDCGTRPIRVVAADLGQRSGMTPEKSM
jgi:hypothetical protein